MDAPQLPEESSAPSSAASPLSGGTPEPAPPPGKQKRRRSKTLLIVLVVTVAVVIPVALTVGLFLYQRVTEPDRSTPNIAVRQFLYAVFEEKNPDRVALFSCKEWPPDRAISVMTAGLGPEIKVSWGGLNEESSTTDAASVSARLTLRLGAASEIQQWRFDATHATDGWRVCGAEQLPS